MFCDDFKVWTRKNGEGPCRVVRLHVNVSSHDQIFHRFLCGVWFHTNTFRVILVLCSQPSIGTGKNTEIIQANDCGFNLDKFFFSFIRFTIFFSWPNISCDLIVTITNLIDIVCFFPWKTNTSKTKLDFHFNTNESSSICVCHSKLSWIGEQQEFRWHAVTFVCAMSHEKLS